MEDMLIENYEQTEDHLSLSHQFDSEVKVNYNMASLMKSEFIYDVDPELVDPDFSDAQFLQRQRIRAE